MTNAELAILSLVAEQPRHGYEIEQVINERGMRDWTEVGFSSIYFVLNKLEKAGLIVSHAEPSAGRGPGRKVYRATPAGEAAFHAAVVDVLSTPRRQPAPFFLGLANLPDLAPAEALAALRQYRDALADRREYVRSNWESKGQLPLFIDAMFDYSITLIEAEMRWVEEFIQRLEEQE